MCQGDAGLAPVAKLLSSCLQFLWQLNLSEHAEKLCSDSWAATVLWCWSCGSSLRPTAPQCPAGWREQRRPLCKSPKPQSPRCLPRLRAPCMIPCRDLNSQMPIEMTGNHSLLLQSPQFNPGASMREERMLGGRREQVHATLLEINFVHPWNNDARLSLLSW